MFSFWGRTVFILFVGLICFGLVDACPTEPPLGPLCAWSYSLGFVTTVNAFFNCYILCEWLWLVCQRMCAVAHLTLRLVQAPIPDFALKISPMICQRLSSSQLTWRRTLSYEDPQLAQALARLLQMGMTVLRIQVAMYQTGLGDAPQRVTRGALLLERTRFRPSLQRVLPQSLYLFALWLRRLMKGRVTRSRALLHSNDAC